MGRRANGVSASPPGSVCPGRPLHRFTPSLYPHHRAPRCTPPAPSPYPIPPSGSQFSPPVSPLPSPTLPAPHARTLWSLSFPSQLNSTLLKHGTICLYEEYHPPRKVLPVPESTQREVYMGAAPHRSWGDPMYSHHMLRSPIPTEAHGRATLFPPPPAGFLLEILPS